MGGVRSVSSVPFPAGAVRTSAARRSLVQAAWAALQDGPVHTADLAASVLRLQGGSGAASAAVFALLGGDDRFVVHGNGLWSRRDGADPPGTPLTRLSYAVVDVETTGGAHQAGHRITEIAIVDVRGGAVAGVFETLVNPCRRIPPRAARLTGISDGMVAGAPTFDDIAERVFKSISGRVFVAHNANFDWGWTRAQLHDALGDAPVVNRLCTISLARRFAPELRRRNLDALAEHFRIAVEGRHRAGADAMATARVLLRLLDRAESRGLCDLHALRKHRPSRLPAQPGLFTEADRPVLGSG